MRFDCSEKARILFDPTTFPIMWCANAVLLAGHVSRGKNDSRNIKSKSLPFLGKYELSLLIEKIAHILFDNGS